MVTEATQPQREVIWDKWVQRRTDRIADRGQVIGWLQVERDATIGQIIDDTVALDAERQRRQRDAG